MSIINNKAIGKGATFPIKLSELIDGTMSWQPVSGDIQLLEDSLRSIMLYTLGQMMRKEDFGNNLEDFLEEPNEQALSFLIVQSIKNSINTWEKRIKPLVSKDLAIIYSNSYSIIIKLHYYITELNLEQTTSYSYNTLTSSLDGIN